MKVYCRICQIENTMEIERRAISFDFDKVISIEEYFDLDYSDKDMTIVELSEMQIILEHPFDEIHSDWMKQKKTYKIYN